MSSSRTVRLLLSYDGTGFRGWAAQSDPRVRTVEGELSRVLEELLREEVRLSVAGRTDAGVHARGQVCSFVTSSPRRPESVQAFVNGRLGPELVVRQARYAPEGFDARFSASAREYRYVVDTGPVADPFTARSVWHRPGALSVPAMRMAARSLVGEHDFTSFCRHPGEDRSTVRNLQRLAVVRDGERIAFALRANAFLHQMVRSLVGTIVRVGEGKLDPDEVARILAARDRSRAAPVAPAQGLTLDRVIYGRRVTSR
jgi:tRNA pseudouridine38-40 synthase